MHLPVHSPDCVQFTVTTCLARWLRLVCVHKSVRVCVYLALTVKTSIIIWLKLPVGVHEAYKRMGLPEIQYANPLRARMLRVLILLSVFCATSALREADKELEKKIMVILKIAKWAQSFERRKTCRGWEECDEGQDAIILVGQVGFHLIPCRSG